MSSRQLSLRRAEERDVAALTRLLRRSWLVTWAPELPFEAVQAFASYDPVPQHVQWGWPSFMVAIRDDALVGVMEVEGDQLVNLDVDPACWNGGVGSRLLDAAEKQIGAAHSVMRLEVRAFNTRARAFYGRRGWTEVRTYPGTECGSPVENVEMQKVATSRLETPGSPLA